jgi:hypothetical protein
MVSARDRQTLVNVVYAAFPHSSFPRGPYERAADVVIEQAGKDPRFLAQLLQGLTDLDAQREAAFADLGVETAAAVLRGADGTPFLTAIVDSAVVTLYSDPEVWELLGYEGPSYDEGGYVDRGFDDLDWLPDPRIEHEEEMTA